MNGTRPEDSTLVITKIKTEGVMQEFVCPLCGYIYDPAVGDPDEGIAPGTPFDELPEDWTCPICGASKDVFLPQA